MEAMGNRLIEAWHKAERGELSTEEQRLLDGRDLFIVRKGLWQEFCDGLDRPEEVQTQNVGERYAND